MQLSEPSVMSSRSAMAVKYRPHGFLDASAQHRPWNCFIRAPAGTLQPCRCINGSEAAQLSGQQSVYEYTTRRATLIAVGISPYLAGVHPVWAEPSSAVDTASSAAEGVAVSSATGDANSDQVPSVSQQQQQEQAAPPDGSQQGSSLSDSVEQADRDDSPIGSIEEEGSSGSDSDSSSDSDSESSSDDEPGELFASSDDNNAAGGSSTSSSNGGGSDGSSGTADSNQTSSSNRGSDSSSSSDPSSSDPSSTSSAGGGGTSISGGGTSSSKPVSRTTMGSNLSVPSYIQILQDSRRSSWPLLAQKIQAREWIELSQLLVQSPFDAVRQACFYIPWALLQSDDFTAAVAARKAYVDYIDHVHALAAIALKAADGVPGADVQVQQSFTLMNASLNAFLSAVPVKYQRYRV